MKEQKKILHAIKKQKRAGVAILISDEIDFKSKDVTRNQKKLYNDKKISSSRGCNNCKYIHTQYQNTEIYQTIINR